MSRVIPKEQLTAYQRWELGSFDAASVEPEPVEDAPPPPEPEPVLSIPLPTAEDIERIQQEAWQEGHDLGFKEGREAGYQDGFASGEADVERLRQLADAFAVEGLRQDEAIAREVLDLALHVARQMLRASLQARPEGILDVIREALQSLPTLSGHHKIVAHPDDVPIVNDWLAREYSHLPWKVLEDANLARGGFRIESAHSELDATLETRWREIVSCLGSDSQWMD